MEALNYTTQALEGLPEWINVIQTLNPKATRSLSTVRWLMEELKAATVFVLPENGRLLNAHGVALEGEFHLPYPVCAIEYPVNSTHSPFKDETREWSPSKKRVALAMEMSLDDINNSPICGFGALPMPADWAADYGIVVAPIYTADEDGYSIWRTSFGFTIIEPVAERLDLSLPEHQKLDAKTREIYEEVNVTVSRESRIRHLPRPLLWDMVENMVAENGVGYFEQIIGADNADELTATLEVIEALACENVYIQDGEHKPSAKLNKKRAKNGKPPMLEYKELRVRIPDNRQKTITVSEATGRHHASPRMHLRRGHIRRYRNEDQSLKKQVFIPATVVNPDTKDGTIQKQYRLVK